MPSIQESVRSFLEIAGSEGLPLTTVDGVTVLTGAYPSREQLMTDAGLARARVTMPSGATALTVAQDTGCGPSGCC